MFAIGFAITAPRPAGGVGGGGEAAPAGMAFIYTPQGDPVTDKDGASVYAKEPA